MIRSVKTDAKRIAHAVFVHGQRVGVNLLPAHFYSNIPIIADLRRDHLWRAARSMHGITAADSTEQLAMLREIMAMLDRDPTVIHAEAIGMAGEEGYGEIEAAVFAAFVMAKRPPVIIQIGCGVSTAVALAAAEAVDGYKPRLVCIDPFPSDFLRRKANAGAIELIDEPAQSVDVATMTSLSHGDLLFIDSTHTVKPGSEVNVIIHEVLPRLKQGVWVHFHDIYFPYDYARDLMSGDLFFPGETSLLYAFLAGNASFRIELALSMLHYDNGDGFRTVIPSYQAQGNDDGLSNGTGLHFPSSLYLRSRANGP
jgi:hypothetical protein